MEATALIEIYVSNHTKLVSLYGNQPSVFQDRVLGYVSRMLKFNSSPAGQNGSHFADDVFRSISMSEMFCILIAWQCISIGLVNGLASNRRQAIIWTNADPIHWRKYAALGGDELTRRGHMATLIWVDVGLVAQSHYLNKCWLIISDSHCRSFQGNFKNWYIMKRNGNRKGG